MAWGRQSEAERRCVLLYRPSDAQCYARQYGYWYRFYSRTFNFCEIRFFNIEGKVTGLHSRALTSPCGKIRIPINESADENSQIEEYLREYNGEGIQHIAVGTDDIYAATDAIAARGLELMPAPSEIYYEKSVARVTGHSEPIDRLRRHGILIDGEGVVDGGSTRVLLQIFYGHRPDLLRIHSAQR